jgi:hypothetical protein
MGGRERKQPELFKEAARPAMMVEANAPAAFAESMPQHAA